MLKKLGDLAMREGMKLMMNPKVMKLMSDPRVGKVMMQAFQLQGTVRLAVEGQRKRIAEVLNLATREEVESLQDTIRDLESELREARANGKGGGAKR